MKILLALASTALIALSVVVPLQATIVRRDLSVPQDACGRSVVPFQSGAFGADMALQPRASRSLRIEGAATAEQPEQVTADAVKVHCGRQNQVVYRNRTKHDADVTIQYTVDCSGTSSVDVFDKLDNLVGDSETFERGETRSVRFTVPGGGTLKVTCAAGNGTGCEYTLSFH